MGDKPVRSRFLRRLGIVLAGLLAAMPVAAVDWESLVSPGQVIAGHAKTESDCKSCHAPFARDEQRKLCLDCHDKVAADIVARTGFHGRATPARSGQCRNCHTDHEGRAADIVRLDPQTFNHLLTDFPLEGGHKGRSCSECHEPKAKYRDARSSCIACHAKEDVHDKKLGEDCGACHAVQSWGRTTFDHRQATDGRYPLTGAHARTDCVLCHAGERYKDTANTCVACHRIDDAHGGRRGTACGDCHDTGSWKQPTFNHAKETGFALTAGHAGLACQACHGGADFKQTAGKACVDCHRSDDSHQGRNGTRCQDCHNTRQWTDSRFDHGTKTDFPLRGAHASLDCVACHKGDVKQNKLDKDCKSCHGDRDPHRNELGGDCGSCHGEKAWRDDIRFDHDLTRFPLVGLHATSACESCHTDRRFKGTPTSCIDCHRKDDTHNQALGETCGTCHTPNDWLIWQFDHDTQTDFKLEGAHAGLQCAACHIRPLRPGVKLAQECVDCHAVDDVHSGQFGRDCQRCHDSTTFATGQRRK